MHNNTVSLNHSVQHNLELYGKKFPGLLDSRTKVIESPLRWYDMGDQSEYYIVK